MGHFELVGPLERIEVIARGVSVRERRRLAARFGGASWREMKSEAVVRLADAVTCRAELLWYEAHGVGRRKMKIKRFLE